MGYTTEFEGAFTIDPPLSGIHFAYLDRFSRMRRMKRDPAILESMRDPLREGAGLPIGDDGEYFVAASGWCGHHSDRSVVDYNEPPANQPGLRCQWRPTTDGARLEWDGIEKFYEYVSWLGYLIDHFLRPWGYRLNGEVRWSGERYFDQGVIRLVDNEITRWEKLWK